MKDKIDEKLIKKLKQAKDKAIKEKVVINKDND